MPLRCALVPRVPLLRLRPRCGKSERHDAVDAHRSCRAQLDSELKLSCTQSPKPIFPTCPSSPKCPNVIIGKVPRALRTHRMRTSRTPGPHLSTESSKIRKREREGRGQVCAVAWPPPPPARGLPRLLGGFLGASADRRIRLSRCALRSRCVHEDCARSPPTRNGGTLADRAKPNGDRDDGSKPLILRPPLHVP